MTSLLILILSFVGTLSAPRPRAARIVNIDNKNYTKATYTTNSVGNPQLVVNGFIFHKKETKKGCYTYWRCAYHKEFR